MTPIACPICGRTFTPNRHKTQRTCSVKCGIVERYYSVDQEARFWSYVLKTGSHDCWPWTGGTNSDGYGNAWLLTTPWKAHRLAWSFAKGPIPDGLQVLHRCDNPPCCNPAHLFLGTRADNMADMVRKGRDGHRRLDERAVQEARRLRREGWTYQAIADRYDVSEATAFYAVKGKTWRHVTDDLSDWAPGELQEAYGR